MYRKLPQWLIKPSRTYNSSMLNSIRAAELSPPPSAKPVMFSCVSHDVNEVTKIAGQIKKTLEYYGPNRRVESIIFYNEETEREVRLPMVIARCWFDFDGPEIKNVTVIERSSEKYEDWPKISSQSFDFSDFPELKRNETKQLTLS